MRKKGVCLAVLLMVSVTLAATVPVMANGGGSTGKSDVAVLYLSGTPREMGLQYGAMAKDAIVENIAQFWGWVAERGLSKDALIADALADESLLPLFAVEELKGMAKTSGVPYGELLAFNEFGDDDLQQHACTCFIAAGTGTVDGRAISSKNRDLNNMQVLLLVEPDDGYKFIGMMSAGALGVSQGINEMGVAIGHTWMPVPEYYEAGYSPFLVNQIVMEQSADVSKSIALISELPKAEGATFVLSDPSVAAFVETVPSVINSPDTVWQVLADGVGVHTNHYVMEPFHSWVMDGFGYFWTVSFARYDRGLELIAENPVVDAPKVIEFTRDLENWGCGSPGEVIDAHPEIPEDTWCYGWPGYSICNARTVSASVFCCDDQYPEEMSTMWMAINNPAWSPYVPLHNGILDELPLAGELLSDYVSGYAWSTSSKLRSTGEWGELIPTFEAWEAVKSAENVVNEDAARSLLSDEDVAGACLLLTEADGAIAQDGVALMESLFDSSAEAELLVVPRD